MSETESVHLTGNVVPLAEVPESIQAYFDALNAEDWSLFANLWTPDAELRAVGSRPRRGREQVVAYFGPLFEPWAEHRDRPARLVLADAVVVVEVEFSGVTRGGNRVTFDAVDVFDLRHGEISRLTTWYDLAWVRGQL